MTVDLEGVFCPLRGLMGAPGVMAGGDGLLGCGWMDCLANFGLLQLDFTRVIEIILFFTTTTAAFIFIPSYLLNKLS